MDNRGIASLAWAMALNLTKHKLNKMMAWQGALIGLPPYAPPYKRNLGPEVSIWNLQCRAHRLVIELLRRCKPMVLVLPGPLRVDKSVAPNIENCKRGILDRYLGLLR